MRKLQIIGAGIGFGQELKGVERAPEAWVHFFNDHAPDVLRYSYEPIFVHAKKDFVSLNSSQDVMRFPFEHYDKVCELVYEAYKSHSLPVCLGGDHSIAMGSIQGSLNVDPNVRVLWVDAHGDINTPETSPTGRAHGMPLSYLLGVWAQERKRVRLKEKNLVLFGVRDLDSGEKKIIKDLNIKVVTSKEIHYRGLLACWDEVFDYLELGRFPVHFSFDVDVMDPSVFAQTGVPVGRGLMVKDIQLLFEKVIELKKLMGVDIVEYNPLLPLEANAIDGRQLIAQFMYALALSDPQQALKVFPRQTTFECPLWP